MARFEFQPQPARLHQHAQSAFPFAPAATHEPLDRSQPQVRLTGMPVGLRRQHQVEQLGFRRKFRVLDQEARIRQKNSRDEVMMEKKKRRWVK
jgi:hypothetical protein